MNRAISVAKPPIYWLSNSVIYLVATLLRMQLRNVNKQQISKKKIFCESLFLWLRQRLFAKGSFERKKKYGSGKSELSENHWHFRLKSVPERVSRPYEKSAYSQNRRTSRNCVTEISVVLWEIVTWKESKFSNFLPIDKAWLVPYGVLCALKWIGKKWSSWTSWSRLNLCD